MQLSCSCLVPLLALTHKVRAFLLGDQCTNDLVTSLTLVQDVIRFSPLDPKVALMPAVFAVHFHPLEKYF